MLDILSDVGLLHAKTASTPMQRGHKFSTNSPLMGEPYCYRCLIRHILYVTMTRPDITFVLQQLSQHVSAPQEAHWDATLYLLHYLKLSPSTGIFISSNNDLNLSSYYDADWASSPRLYDLLRDIVSSLVRHLYLGKLRSRPLFLAPRLKLNIGALLPLFVSSYGYRIYFAILISLFLFLYLFCVIIKQPSILLLIPFFMSAPSTWILIATLFMINLSLASLTLNIFLLVSKWQICLPRLCLLPSLIFCVPS